MQRAIGAVVARFVHTEEVTGSNPVSPTSKHRRSEAGFAKARPASCHFRATIVPGHPELPRALLSLGEIWCVLHRTHLAFDGWGSCSVARSRSAVGRRCSPGDGSDCRAHSRPALLSSTCSATTRADFMWSARCFSRIGVSRGGQVRTDRPGLTLSTGSTRSSDSRANLLPSCSLLMRMAHARSSSQLIAFLRSASKSNTWLRSSRRPRVRRGSCTTRSWTSAASHLSPIPPRGVWVS